LEDNKNPVLYIQSKLWSVLQDRGATIYCCACA